ncbi:MAG TPA: aminotransferase class III-fold pyridoxal phosphate-dependent enzyme, partial [Candidatus Dormibacteraeota bacterium]
GTAGIMPPPAGYLAGLRDICNRYGLVYIADEVMAGFGRTGAWWAFDNWSIAPDLIAFAKGVTSGYVPLGGVVISDAIAADFDNRAYPGGLTYSGHPLACATAVATIQTMQDEGIVENAARIGTDVLGPGLRALAERHPSVGEVRGLGVFWALELVADRATREPLAPFSGTSPAMADVTAACKQHGLLPFTTANRIHVVPPCTISAAEALEGLEMLDQALVAADRHYTGA